MKLDLRLSQVAALLLCQLSLSACTFNPFTTNNHTTGTLAGTAVGAGIGAGVVALIGGTKGYIALGGLGGGALGYYFSSIRSDASGIIDAGGKVYLLGDYMGIYIPSDHLFEPNTAEFLPSAHRTLDSVVDVLNRKPDNNIMISGNTSGFNMYPWEQRLSARRAKAVAAYLWVSGIVQFKEQSSDMRKLKYVGYGDYFPITSKLTNNGLRENSRIQITSYPSYAQLRPNEHKISDVNIAGDDRTPTPGAEPCGRDNDYC